MNPVFWIIILIITILLFFASAILFRPLGRFVANILNDTKDIINDEETEDKE